ncbi:hypothetical protein BDD43_5036 [Mucilaginibacter gracilis]|uniref:Uncharacterized protein n=1 Tax=Mucilaginibacter gracilis TaxID=423350 RepID=A0A495J7R3_9SPHI|nr:hypothetical protein [Mucilaginibacter gracilis]RKR84783.1 hypothetical protein BDD43_5036 [Mucilaginibacter gracilis]
MEKLYLVNQNRATPPNFYRELEPYVLIFKTNIKTQGDKFTLKPLLDAHPLISHWNVDLEDIDCVLRIVTSHLCQQNIADLLTRRGYYCTELD